MFTLKRETIPEYLHGTVRTAMPSQTKGLCSHCGQGKKAHTRRTRLKCLKTLKNSHLISLGAKLTPKPNKENLKPEGGRSTEDDTLTRGPSCKG